MTLVQPKESNLYRNFTADPFAFWGQPVGKNNDGTYWCPGFFMQGDVPGTHACAYTQRSYDKVDIALGSTLAQNQLSQTPGIARLNVKKGRRLNVKPPDGSDGERATFHGMNCGRIEIQLLIWTPEQLYQLRLLWNIIQPPQGKKNPKAFSVYHPELAESSISQMQFYEIEGPVDGPARRSKIYLIRGVEFLPPGAKSAVVNDEAPAPLAGSVPALPGTDPKHTGPKA